MKLTDEILFDVEDGIAVITIDRPQQRNAINRGVNEGLHKAFELFENDASLRVAILTGSGDKAFCAGHGPEGGRGHAAARAAARTSCRCWGTPSR